jgi:predicted dehydrogenase
LVNRSSSPNVLTAALIGTGKISEEHLRFLTTSPRVRVVGVCDLSPSLARYASERFGGGRPFTHHPTMLSEMKPDVVHVLTPPGTHVGLVSDCLRAGAHVIVEKPVAPTHAEFLELAALAKSVDRRLIEDHNYRFNRPVLKIERLVEEGSLGEVHEVDVRMALNVRKAGSRYADPHLPHPSHKLPAGVIHEFVTHLCYLAMRFGGEKAEGKPQRDEETVPRVAAAWSKHGDDALFRVDDLDALMIDGPIHRRIRFTSHAGPDAFTLTVRGTRGWAEADLFQPYLRVVGPRAVGSQLSPLANHVANGWSLVTAGVVGFWNKVMQVTPYEGLQRFLAETYDALAFGGDPPVTFDDMDRVSRLVDALLCEKNRI